jgi:hypothetical protein
MLAAVRPLVEEVLALESAEREFLDLLLDEGDYRPDLLFPGQPEIVRRIERHPALLWKAQNVRQFRAAGR